MAILFLLELRYTVMFGMYEFLYVAATRYEDARIR